MSCPLGVTQYNTCGGGAVIIHSLCWHSSDEDKGEKGLLFVILAFIMLKDGSVQEGIYIVSLPPPPPPPLSLSL